MNNLIYNGISLRELGFAIKDMPVHKVAERDVEFVSVTGRSGDVIVDNARYKNVDFEYGINTIDFRYLQNTDVTERKLIDWLMAGGSEYKILEDTTYPGYFCKALCTGIGDIVRKHLNGFLDTTISFNREPYWYSKIGQNMLEFPAQRTEQTIVNPENYIAQPYIRIYNNSGSGPFKLVINDDEYDFSSINEYIELDSEEHSVFKGSTNQSTLAQFNYMPILKPGVNTFAVVARQSSMQQYFTKIEITPRWRRL